MSISISERCKYIVSGGSDLIIKLYHFSSGSLLRKFHGKIDELSIRSVIFSANEKFIISGSGDNTIKIRNIENYSDIKILKGH